jgi:hypothetical protein
MSHIKNLRSCSSCGKEGGTSCQLLGSAIFIVQQRKNETKNIKFLTDYMNTNYEISNNGGKKKPPSTSDSNQKISKQKELTCYSYFLNQVKKSSMKHFEQKLGISVPQLQAGLPAR